MERKLLYTVGNLGQGYAYGVEAEGQFGTLEIHGPFTTENQANTYAHGLVEDRNKHLWPESGPFASVKVVRIETPQAGRRIVRNEWHGYEYAV